MNQAFQFKQFTIEQDRCAMKVGTDGVLLGAWVSLKTHPSSILDIGAGTGIIALQLAQRSNAEIIDGLEIDDDAYEQCVENFENSPWGDRLFCYHASLETFTSEMEDKYDLIVSNPPFYAEDYKTPNESRDMARFNDAMPFGKITDSVSKLLSDKGLFALIIPRKEEDNFIKTASKAGLFPHRICRVRGSVSSKVKRSMLELTFHHSDPIIEHLVIEVSRHDYTEDYKKLVRDFYLKM